MNDNTAISMKYGQLADMVNRIEQIPPLTGTGAPTTSTPAWYIGQRYIDTQSNNEYYCVEIPSSGVVGYVWQPVDTSTSYTGGDGINIDAQNVISATNTGKAKVLTTEDYDYPTNNPERVAVWNLESGIYVAPQANLALTNSRYVGYGHLVLVSKNASSDVSTIVDFDTTSNDVGFYRTRLSGGGAYATAKLLSSLDMVNNLNSTSTTYPLAANQGRVLKSQIGDLTTLDTTAQTDLVSAINEVASAGGVTELTADDYNWETNNPYCVALWLLEPGFYYTSSDVKILPDVYNRVSSEPCFIFIGGTSTIGTGQYRQMLVVGGSPDKIYAPLVNISGGQVYTYIKGLTGGNLKSSTGTSTTDTMNQNAITSMIYVDPNTKQKVRIGDNSGANGLGSVAIGASAVANGEKAVAVGTNSSVLASYKGSVALGSYSKPTSSGQVDISVQGVASIVQDYSYNNSGYRLLSGLYDGQSDHDAVTVGQLNTAIAGVTGAEEITSEDWSALWQ